MSNIAELRKCKNCGTSIGISDTTCPFCGERVYHDNYSYYSNNKESKRFNNSKDDSNANKNPLGIKMIIRTILNLNEPEELYQVNKAKKRKVKHFIRIITHVILPHYSFGLANHKILFYISVCLSFLGTIMFNLLNGLWIESLFCLLAPSIIAKYALNDTVEVTQSSRSFFKVNNTFMGFGHMVVTEELPTDEANNNYVLAIIGLPISILSIMMLFKWINHLNAPLKSLIVFVPLLLIIFIDKMFLSKIN